MHAQSVCTRPFFRLGDEARLYRAGVGSLSPLSMNTIALSRVAMLDTCSEVNIRRRKKNVGDGCNTYKSQLEHSSGSRNLNRRVLLGMHECENFSC